MKYDDGTKLWHVLVTSPTRTTCGLNPSLRYNGYLHQKRKKNTLSLATAGRASRTTK